MYKSENYKSFSEALLNATGSIDYNMTNDYMFRAILQKNQKVLKGLICALLHLNPNDVKSISIMNPIELGAAFDDKSFILDIKVLLNDDKLINLEMQVADQLNWSDRSLLYLCRSFDQLEKGEEYSEAKPAIHIGFLCFTPFKEHPEFYATYKLMNVKTHHIYNSVWQDRISIGDKLPTKNVWLSWKYRLMLCLLKKTLYLLKKTLYHFKTLNFYPKLMIKIS